MARITVEDCLRKGYNKFALVHLAAKRVMQFRKGKEPLVERNNREIVIALREIEAGKVRMRTDEDQLEAPALTDIEVESEAQGAPGTDAETETIAEVDSGAESEAPEEEATVKPDDHKEASDTA
jgi:DNA-directed RNA polymerase subunit omega